MAERIDRTSQPSAAVFKPVARERVFELSPKVPSNPPVFRAWVANRLLGENLRAALSPVFEKAQKTEPTPFARYMSETRDTLKTIKARPYKEILLALPQRAPEAAAIRESQSVTALISGDLAPVKSKLQLNPKLEAQRAVSRFKAEVDSLVPLSIAAPKLRELSHPRLESKPADFRPLPEFKAPDFKTMLPELKSNRFDNSKPDFKMVDVKPMLADIKSIRFNIKTPVQPEVKNPPIEVDFKPMLPEFKTIVSRFDFRAPDFKPDLKKIDFKAFKIKPMLSEIKTNLTRFDFKGLDVKPVQPEVKAPSPQPKVVPLVRPQNAQREVFSGNEVRPSLRPLADNAVKVAVTLPQPSATAATLNTNRPVLIRTESTTSGLSKQTSTSNEARTLVEKSSQTVTRSAPPGLSQPAGGNPARLTFSSPTTVRGDLTNKSTPAEPLVALKVGPKAPLQLQSKGPAPTTSANEAQKTEKREAEEPAARPASLEQKLRTSSSEPLRSQAAKATHRALEGKEEPATSEERPALAVAPIQALQREEKADEKEDKESSRSVLSGGMGGQAPIAPIQSFHQDERSGGSSPNFAPPRQGGSERRPPEQPRQHGEDALAAKARAHTQAAQLSAGQMAQHQDLSQKQQDQDKRVERNSEEHRDSKSVEAKKDAAGGSSKSGRGTESEQARRQQAQQQRQQNSSGKADQSGRPRYVTRPQDADEPQDITSAEGKNARNCCAKCGYVLGGSADLACPVCTTEQPDLALRIFTQYRQQGAHWITCADTLAVSEDARHSLAELASTTVHLHFVPKIPKYSQVLKLSQK